MFCAFLVFSHFSAAPLAFRVGPEAEYWNTVCCPKKKVILAEESTSRTGVEVVGIVLQGLLLM